MKILISIILGLIQGLTEFLPISSSGHLVLAEHFLNFKTLDMSYEVFLHFGSLIAVIVYFRKDISSLFLSLFQWKKGEAKQNHKSILFLIIATIFTTILALLFKDFFESLFSKPLYAAIMLSVTGFILFFSDKKFENKIKMHSIGIIKSITIGIAQAFAILPGISRSGSTIATSIYLGIERDSAARFSFLLSIPAILGALVLNLDSLKGLSFDNLIIYIIGAIAAFVSGYAVISLLLNIIKKNKLRYFSYYCWSISIITIIILTLGF